MTCADGTPAADVYLALGANLGRREATLQAAVDAIGDHPQIQLCAVSRCYETDPVGGPAGQPDYLNAAIHISTDLSPVDLLGVALAVEENLGRQRSVPDAPRSIDIDVLLYASLVLDSPELTIPHPRMHLRSFVLAPLADIAADILHPVQYKTIAQMLNALVQRDLDAGAACRLHGFDLHIPAHQVTS